MQQRFKKLAKQLVELDLDAFIIENPTDLFYFTGGQLSAGTLIAGREKSQLIVDGRYIVAAEKNSPVPVVLLEKGVVKRCLQGYKRVGFDSNITSYACFERLKEIVPEPVSCPGLLQRVRSTKWSAEIEALREAAKLNVRGYEYVKSQLREGVSEKELARELQIFWLQEGGEKLSFDPIIAFGSHSAMPHHKPTDLRLEPNTPVLIDIGIQLNHYQSDMTRVDFFGEPHAKMLEIYDVVSNAIDAARGILRPGVKAGELDRAARTVIEEAGYGENFSHNLGHGVGLVVHELPRLRQQTPDKEVTIEESMVITIEPGIYLPDFGGVRLEDTYVVTDSGWESLTSS